MILLVIWTLVEHGEGSSALPLAALYAFAAVRLFYALIAIYAVDAALRGNFLASAGCAGNWVEDVLRAGPS